MTEVQRIQLATTTEERYRHAIDRELAEFERREREFMDLSQNGDKSWEGSQARVCDTSPR